jgi:hypothetical protein
MKLVRTTFIAAALGGCVAVPVNPGYYGEAPGYYAPAPGYYAPLAYYGPSIGIGINGGRRGSYGRGYRYR